MKKKKAYSYRRFSSGKQSKGSSIQRQGEKAVEFCKRHNLELADVFTDSGVSAWKGKNFSPDFALGKFYELAQKGQIEKGSVLVIENLDRLSREEITDCAAKFLQIVNSGIAIGLVDKDIILDTGRFLTMDTFEGNNEDPLSLHKYLYAENNPVNMMDPLGHDDIGDIVTAVTDYIPY